MKHRPKIITDGRNGDFGRQCSGPIAKKAAFWGRWVAMFRPRRRKTASGAGVGGNGPALKRGRGLARPHTRLYCMVYLLVWVVYPRPNWVVFTGGSGWLCSGVGTQRRSGSGIAGRSPESPLLETLRIYHQSSWFPPQNLDPVSAPVQEDEGVPAEQTAVHPVRHYAGKCVVAFPHVRRLGIQPVADGIRKAKHG